MKQPKHQPGRSPLRGLAVGIVAATGLLLLFLLYVLGRPLYWKFYAEVIHRYEPDPALALIREIEQESGQPLAAAGGNRKVDPGASPQQQLITGKHVDLSKLTLEQLERLKEKAREKQWEDEWWKLYQKKENERREKVAASYRSKEKTTISMYNMTLTRESVHRVAKDGYLFVTWANHHYTDFALTWVQHMKLQNITNFMVGAMDDKILASLARRSIPTFSMQSGLTTGDFGWGSPTFAKMGRKKISLIAMFLKLDVQVVISDVDVMWLRDPVPFFKRFPDADVLTSTDHLASTVEGREELERYPEAGSAFNIGIMLFRKKALPFVEEWVRVIESDDKIWDQNAFNDLARKGQQILPDDPNHYFKGDDGKLVMGVLPLAYFASGHVYFTQRMHETLGIQPYAVHATFQFSGTPGKKNRFREAGLWLEQYEYYRPKNGFLAYESSIPRALLDGAGPRTGKMDINNTIGHFELVNYQLKELRNAMALATVLNRTLVLPAFWCGLDRYWAPHAGTLPGSEFKLPFPCPADHVLDLENGFSRHWDENEFGPNLDYREASFLNSTGLPHVIKESAVNVVVCTKGKGYCPEPDAPGTVDGNKIFLQENLLSEQIKLTLSPVSHVQVLKFSTMQNAFGNFTQEQDYTKFLKRMHHMGSVWCCIDAHPGHIHYDLWWDIPHTDKFGRKWDTQWQPTAGP
uniref:Nucleotide-diphospho-sugar transferase domain-containing protein n=1 Tax=Tetradesmus obliquus TaxID=3088 RepID=A0A383W3X9_TETOB|eukprot:jgi/Sobl393_1/15582/SZX71714.1